MAGCGIYYYNNLIFTLKNKGFKRNAKPVACSEYQWLSVFIPNTAGAEALNDLINNVITSYSIHYTKLYEWIKWVINTTERSCFSYLTLLRSW